MNNNLDNQLAQVCNNLHCIIRQHLIKHRFNFPADQKLYNVYCELRIEYNTLFKLIYGNE